MQKKNLKEKLNYYQRKERLAKFLLSLLTLLALLSLFLILGTVGSVENNIMTMQKGILYFFIGISTMFFVKIFTRKIEKNLKYQKNKIKTLRNSITEKRTCDKCLYPYI